MTTEPKKCANECGAALQDSDRNNVCEACRAKITTELELTLAGIKASLEAMKKKGWSRYL